MAKALTLLLHTSSPTTRIGLADGDTMIARDEFPVAAALSETLSARVRDLLTTQNLEPRTLTRIVVHAGPGGFTSLRIGVTTANALAYALDVPVVGVFGDIKDLDDLLTKSKDARGTPAPRSPKGGAGFVIPMYAREPNIGPVPN